MNRSVAGERGILALAKRDERPAPETEHDDDRGTTKPDPEPDRPKQVPTWVPSNYWELWQKPWDDAASRSAKFRELCWKSGFASPHFERKETACHDPQNSSVPERLRANAQREAFNLEKASSRAR